MPAVGISEPEEKPAEVSGESLPAPRTNDDVEDHPFYRPWVPFAMQYAARQRLESKAWRESLVIASCFPVCKFPVAPPVASYFETVGRDVLPRHRWQCWVCRKCNTTYVCHPITHEWYVA